MVTRLINTQFRHGGAVIQGGQKDLEGGNFAGANRRTFRGGNQSFLRGRPMDLSPSHESGPLVWAAQVLSTQIHRTAKGGIRSHFVRGNQSVLRFIKGGQHDFLGAINQIQHGFQGGNHQVHRAAEGRIRNQSVLGGRSMDLSSSHKSGPLVRATQVLNTQIHRTAKRVIRRRFPRGNQCQTQRRTERVIGSSPGDRVSPGSELLNRLKGQVGAKGPVGRRKPLNGSFGPKRRSHGSKTGKDAHFYLSQVSKGEIKKQKREKYYAPEVLSPRGVEGD
jgi:hypothetical protein